MKHEWVTIRWHRIRKDEPFVQRCSTCGDHRRFHHGRWVPSGIAAKDPCEPPYAGRVAKG